MRETPSFVALLPSDAPRIALVVVIDQPDGYKYAVPRMPPEPIAIRDWVT
jgi:cell division protein FtsI/penicillin-binding protein 2